MKIDLSVEEAEALLRLLDWTLPELREEVHKTDSEAMRGRLKEQERVLGRLKERLDEELVRVETTGVS